MKNDDIIAALTKAFIARAPQMAADYAEAAAGVLRGASVEQLLALAGAERRTKTRVRNRSKVAAKAAPLKSVDTDATVKALAAKLRTAPKAGLSGEQLQTDLGLNRGRWRKVMALALSTGVMRKKGLKRATRYFAK